jgi:hypothetical protein
MELHASRNRTCRKSSTSSFCADFRTPALMSDSGADAGGVRKAPRHEIAVEQVTACRERHGDLVPAAGLMSLD